MKNIKTYFLFGGATAILALTGCVSTTTEGVMSPETRKSGFMGLNTSENVKVSTAKAFAGHNQVVIGGFKVGFNESKRMSRKAGGGLMGSGFGGKSTGLVKLEGINSATKQAITNQAYNDFLTELKSKGYTVVSRSDFTGNAAYKGTKEYQFPYVDDNSGMLSSYGAATYYSPNAIGSKQPIFMGEIQGVTGGIGFSNPGNAAAKYSKESNIPVLNVTYLIDFAGSDGHGSYWTQTSSLKVGQMLSVDQGYLGLTGGYGGTFSTDIGSLSLGQPIASDKEFAKIVDASSGTEKGVETAVNLASAVLGGGTNISRKYVYDANPSQFKAASMDVLSQANDAFTGKMASLR